MFPLIFHLGVLSEVLDLVASRVAEICEIKLNDIFLRGIQQKRIKPKSLFCYWAVRELGIFLTELARQLGISVDEF